MGLDTIERDGRIKVTILSEPRPDEPQGLGAVVEAQGVRWVRILDTSGKWMWHAPDGRIRDWKFLVDPVILADGWTPPPLKHGMADAYNLADCRHCGHIRKRHSLSMSGCSVCSCSEFEL